MEPAEITQLNGSLICNMEVAPDFGMGDVTEMTIDTKPKKNVNRFVSILQEQVSYA